MSEPPAQHGKSFLRTFGTALAVTIVAIALLIGTLQLLYSGSSRKQQDVFEQIRNGTLAQVCVLTLPSDPKTGRDPDKVLACLIENGLKPKDNVP